MPPQNNINRLPQVLLHFHLEEYITKSIMQRCSAESVKALFDSEETRNNRISLQANHQEVDVFCQSSDHERTMVIAFDKGSNSPAEKAILKKSA